MGHLVADGIIGYEIDRMVLFNIGYQLSVVLAALGGLGIETDGTRQVDGINFVGMAHNDSRAVGLPVQACHLGMTRFPKYDHLSTNGTHLLIALTYAALQGKDNGTCGINKVNAAFCGDSVG